MPEVTRELELERFDISYWWKNFSLVGEQIWRDSGQKYKEREYQEMEGCGTVCEPPLYHE